MTTNTGREESLDGRHIDTTSAASETPSDMVSVIVPVYQTAEWLPDCVASLVSQTHRNVQVILVDDGSTDGSAELCDAYQAADSRIISLHQENTGPSAARNAGLQHASGEWVLFLDSDDWLETSCLEKMLSCAHSLACDLVLCGTAKVKNHQGLTYIQPSNATPICYSSGSALLRDVKHHPHIHPVSVCGKLYRRGLWLDLRFPAGRLHEDIYITHRALLNARGIAVHPETLHYYRQRDGSITRRNMNLQSASDKARGHLERSHDLREVDLLPQSAVDFNRGLGWHLRVLAETQAAHVTIDSSLSRELAEQARIIKHDGLRIAIGPKMRMLLLLYYLSPPLAARLFTQLRTDA